MPQSELRMDVALDAFPPVSSESVDLPLARAISLVS